MAIEMPEKLANIGAYAFQSCNALESVKLNNGLRIIGQYSFYECTGLMEISVPDSVETIGISAFGECSNLAKITLPFIGSGDDESESPFGYVFGANSWSENGLVPEALKTVIITNGDGSILANAFHYCQYIEYLTLPDNTTTIEEYAFHNCSALKEITFGSELATVGNDAFNGCPSLTTVNFGGTEDQWNSIVFGDNNFQITDAEIKLVDESSIPAQTAPMGERQYVRDPHHRCAPRL